MDTSAFAASIISQLLAARPDWAFLNFWQVSDIMKDRTRFPAPQPTTDDNARSNTIPMDQTPPSFKYINGPDVPYVYREVLPTPLKRANFVEGLPHLKCKFGPLPPGELSPTKSYSSFTRVLLFTRHFAIFQHRRHVSKNFSKLKARVSVGREITSH